MEGRKGGGFKAVGDLNIRPGNDFVNIVADVMNQRSKYTWEVGSKFADAKKAEANLTTALSNIKKLMMDTEKARAAFKAPQSLQGALDTAEADLRDAEQHIQDILSGEDKKHHEARARELNKKVLLKRQDSTTKLNAERKTLLQQLQAEQDKLLAAKEAKIQAEQVQRPKFSLLRKKKATANNNNVETLNNSIKQHESAIADFKAKLDATAADAELDNLEKQYADASTIADNYEASKKQLLADAEAALSRAKANIEKCHDAIEKAQDEYYSDIDARCMHGLVNLYQAYVEYSNAFKSVNGKNANAQQFTKLLLQAMGRLETLLDVIRCSELRDKITLKEVVEIVRALSEEDKVHILTQIPDSKTLAKYLNPAHANAVPVTAAGVLTASLFKRASTIGGVVNPLMANSNNSNNTGANPKPPGSF